MGDLLGAESLIFAIISALFGFWFEAIIKTAELTQTEANSIDVKYYFNVKTIYKKIKALSASLILISAIFTPDAIRIMVKSIKFGFRVGIKNYLSNYDALSTAYFLILILILIATGYSIDLLIKNQKNFKIVEAEYKKSNK